MRSKWQPSSSPRTDGRRLCGHAMLKKMDVHLNRSPKKFCATRNIFRSVGLSTRRGRLAWSRKPSGQLFEPLENVRTAVVQACPWAWTKTGRRGKMIRKSIFALATALTLGSTSLATNASAANNGGWRAGGGGHI